MTARKGTRRMVAVIASVVASIAVGVPLLVGAQDPAALRPAIDARYSDLSWISTENLTTWMGRPEGEQPVLLDVRTPEEFAVSHLEGARRVDPDRPNLEELSLPNRSTVVVYCSVGYRSGAIVETLKRTGLTRIYSLTGGIFQWANENRPLFRGSRRTRLVHPYDRLWGRMIHESRRAPLDPIGR